MQIGDVRLIESFDGGDYVLKGNDIEMISGFQNMPYIGLFGGNKQLTTGPKVNEQEFDFWGNFLFHPSAPEIWVNSETENLLKNVSLNTATRIKIEQTVLKDLQFMKEFATLNVRVELISVDRIRIVIEIQEPNQLNSTVYSYLWNATEQELQPDQSNGVTQGNGVALNVPLNFGL